MIPKEVLDGIVWDTLPKAPYGGQHVALMPRGVSLTHEEFGFKIEVASARSQHAAKNFCMTVFELFLGEKGLY